MWAFIGTPLVYPVVALCGGDLAAFGLQEQPLHVLPQVKMG